jgi:nucleotide-binding universal stress UspA family protein
VQNRKNRKDPSPYTALAVIQLAYDGSLNGDWVARHAIRLASHEPARRLGLLHVLDGSVERAALEARIGRISREAAARGVRLEPRLLPVGRGVFEALDAALPRGPDALVVCGTRVRSRRGFLRGTVSQRLLGQRVRPVAAIRVVQPGLLGDPRHFLVPLSSNRAGLAGAWRFLRAFLHGAERVVLLRVVSEPLLWGQPVSERRARARREEAFAFLREVTAELGRQLEGAAPHLDHRVVVHPDWARAVPVQASQLHARMILMGASERTLLARALSNPLERVLRDTPCDVGICRST